MRIPADAPTGTGEDAPLEDVGKTIDVDLWMCSACTAVVEHDTVVCVTCGFHREQGRRVYIDRDREPTERERQLAAEQRAERRTQLVGAIVLIALSGITMAVMLGSATGSWWGWLAGPGLVAAWAAVKLCLMWFATLAAARLAGENMEPVGLSVLRVIAVGLTAHMARTCVLYVSGIAAMAGGMGLGGGFAVALVLLIAFLIVPMAVFWTVGSWLFKLELQDQPIFVAAWYLSEGLGYAALALGGLPG